MSYKAIFLDRDDTLIEDPGYINNPKQVALLDGVPEALIALRDMGYKLIVATNQSGVARGIVTEKVLAEIHERLSRLLGERGIRLDKIYYCPYHPEGVIEKYRKESDLRKPNPGMLLLAAKEMDIDLDTSWTIGNSSRDVEAGARAGCKTILLADPTHQTTSKSGQTRPDHNAVNIKEAVNIIKQYHRSSRAAKNISEPESEQQPVEEIQEQNPPPEETSHAVEAEQVETVDKPRGAEQLLTIILEQMKVTQRDDMFDEFSVMRLLAGIVQVAAIFCLIISGFILWSPTPKPDSALIALGFAAVLQMMALTFYTMQGRK